MGYLVIIVFMHSVYLFSTLFCSMPCDKQVTVHLYSIFVTG